MGIFNRFISSKPPSKDTFAKAVLDGIVRAGERQPVVYDKGQFVRDQGKAAILVKVPNVNETEFPPLVAKELCAQRDYHNVMLRDFCEKNRVPLTDICSRLRDEHIGDELHPSNAGAKIIAEEVFKVLAPMHKAWRPCEEKE